MSRTPVLWVLGSVLAGGACSYERDEGLNGPVPVIFGASQAGSPGSGGDEIASTGKSGSGGGSASAASSGGGGATLASGGRAGATASGSGTSSPGGCEPGAARCDAVIAALRTCDDSGNWQTETCPFVCRAGACGGECRPGERRCDGLQPMRCNDLGAWITDGQTCSVMCQRGACTGMCSDGDKQCSSANAEQICADNVWDVPVPCAFVCVDGACSGECQPGKKRCSDVEGELEVCSAEGQWVASVCPDGGACSGGACVTCLPGAARCASPATLETCGSNHEWGPPEPCPNACIGTRCTGECAPGARVCTGSGKPSQKLCNDQGMFVTNSCGRGQSCTDGRCDAFPKVIFVTSELFDGNLGGVSGADQKCQELADRAGMPGQFLALVNEPGRTIFERFDGDGGPYLLTDGTLVANHFEELGNALGALDLTELGSSPREPDLEALSDAGRAELVEQCRERRLESLVWCNAPVTGVGKNTCSGFSTSEGVVSASFCDWSEPDWDRPCGVSAPEDAGYCKIRAPIVCIQR
jgi:hypothetical protein